MTDTSVGYRGMVHGDPKNATLVELCTGPTISGAAATPQIVDVLELISLSDVSLEVSFIPLKVARCPTVLKLGHVHPSSQTQRTVHSRSVIPSSSTTMIAIVAP